MRTITPVPVGHPDAVAVLRAYIGDIAGRYYGRPATEAEIEQALADEPSDHLQPPGGLFLMAVVDGSAAGCVGVHSVDERVAELNRLFVQPAFRGQGLGEELLRAAEEAARGLGAGVMRLDTRTDLTEARSLYAKHGYRETPHYTTGPYVDHCFEKSLSPQV
ncbi:GNAT family N-acetyltransferase [Amycolatopsis acidicola]|uniref:GNAT family N-acetyltransferase n=1 Tax=Amycolatopsis acidicola TaxID=2596893 RepID=A0A5N0VJA5_9PSEU|nr:GNAT family N-acetyltransferase [Amycolatopsis acidicola]KAA9165738.1 GNAT family N-acetyltransferase [Amycolatopsis acidicola]